MADTIIPAAVVLRAMTAQRLTLHLAVDASWTELSAAGYQPRLLRWTEHEGTAQAAAESFRFGGPTGVIYGYFVTDQDGTILARERIRDDVGNPPVIRVPGDEIIITPRMVAQRTEV
jgi:hypothetical protein